MYLRLFTLGAVCAVACLACSTDTVPDGDPAPRGDGGMAVEAAELEIVGETSFALGIGQAEDFYVRYQEADGTPIADAPVRFALVGRANDSSLNTLDAETDSNGLASGRVLAGRIDSTFRVRITADRAAPVSVEVTVSDRGFGSLLVNVEYEGERAVTEKVISIFSGTDCSGSRVLEDAGDRVPRRLGAAEDETRFLALGAEQTYAVVARGYGDKDVALAFGCSDDVTIVAGEEVETTVRMTDLDLVADGAYAAEVDLGTAGPAALLGERAAEAGGSFLEMSGGGATLLLDMVESTLREAELDADADAVMAAREGGALDASLETWLLDVELTLEGGVAGLSERLTRETERVVLAGRLELDSASDTADARWTMDGVRVSEDVATAAGRTVDLAALDAAPMTSLDARLVPSEDALDVDEMRVTLPLGTLGVATLRAWAEDEETETLGPLFGDGVCTSFEAWTMEQPELTAHCDEACVATACDTARDLLAGAVADSLPALDARRAVISLGGRVDLADEEGNLRVDTLSGGELAGEWLSSSGEESDPVAGTLSGSRAIE